MNFDRNLLRNRTILTVTDEGFGVTFTHWTRKRKSWLANWRDVAEIDAMLIEPGIIGLLVCMADGREAFLAEDMENWTVFEETVRRQYPDFNWDNYEQAKRQLDKRLLCWKRS